MGPLEVQGRAIALRVLVERLRGGFDGPPYPRNLQTEAADAIETLARRKLATKKRRLARDKR
jgi:hypothetical protein